MNPPSIRQRLSRAVVAGSLVCAAAVSVSVWLAAQQEVDELLDDTLGASSDVLGSLLQDPAPPAPAVGPTTRPLGHFVWQVVNATQRVDARSAGAPDEPLSPLPKPGFFDTPLWRV
jgi:hypothetical protein